MAITKKITEPPEAPQRNDPKTFADKADKFVAWLENFGDEINEWTDECNQTEAEINQKVDEAETYRDETQALRDEVALLSDATIYNDTATYNFPDLVIGSDGHVYRCMGTNIQGDNPVYSTTGNWLKFSFSFEELEAVKSEVGTTAITAPTVRTVERVKAGTTFYLYGNRDELYTSYKDNGAEVSHLEWELPDGSIVTGDSISYTAPSETGQRRTFICRACDTLGNKSKDVSVSVDITDNTQPFINSISWDSEEFFTEETYTLTIDAVDWDGDSLSYSVTSYDATVTITQDESEPNKFHITFPDYENDTQVDFTITVSDSHGDSMSIETTVDVYARPSMVASLEIFDAQTDSFFNYFNSITKDDEHNIYFAGEWEDILSDGQIYPITLKLNPDKTINSAIIYLFRDGEFIQGKIHNGYLWLCGSACDSQDNICQAVLKVDPADLTNIENYFFQSVDDSGSVSSWANRLFALDFDSVNLLYVCGSIKLPHECACILKFSNDLSLLLDKKYEDASGNDYNYYFYNITIDDTDTIFCVGVYSGISGYQSGFLCKFDTNLNLLLSKQVSVPTGGANTAGFYSIFVNDNYLYVCGHCYNSNNKNGFNCPALFKFDTDFNLQSVFLFKSPGRFRGLVFLDDYFYIVGTIRGGIDGSQDVLVVKLNKNTFTAEQASAFGTESADSSGPHPVILDNNIIKIVSKSDLENNAVLYDVYNLLDGSFSGTNTDFQMISVRYGEVLGEDVGTGDGTTTEFYLNYSNVVSDSETIYINDTEVNSYTIDYDTGKITFDTPPSNGASITADYQYDRFEYPDVTSFTIEDASLTEYANTIVADTDVEIETTDVTSSFETETDDLV